MSASFDSAQFRVVLGHVPTSVVVVTGLNAQGSPFGITIGSFASVSLDPPLVGFFPGVRSQSWAAIRESGRFCVNVLGPTKKKCVGGLQKKATTNLPVLNGCLQPEAVRYCQALLHGLIVRLIRKQRWGPHMCCCPRHVA